MLHRGFPPEGIGPTLALLNACLNFTSFVLLMTAWRAIRRGDRATHKKLMLAAITVASLFLISYVTRMTLTGTTYYPGGGWLRTAYQWVLGTHTVLAMSLVFLVPRAVFLALKERFAEHKRIARWAFPIWVYVSITGVLVYLMLYQLPLLPPDRGPATSLLLAP